MTKRLSISSKAMHRFPILTCQKRSDCRLLPALAGPSVSEDLGIIKQYAAVIDAKKIGLEIIAFTFVNLSPHNRKTGNAFLAKIRETPRILECYNITGNWDYLLKIVSPDIASYRDFVIDSLLAFPGTNKIESTIVLSTDKQSFSFAYRSHANNSIINF